MLNSKAKPASSSYSSFPSMSISGVQGQLLEVSVVGCNKLKDTEWISRQDPYVCLEYASTKHRTRTCTDGGKNPKFQEKFVFTLIEGLREISVVVWNSNTLTFDDFIGSGKVQLLKVLSQGYDDSAWTLQDKRGKHAGEVRLIMHYANANKPAGAYPPAAPSAPPAPYSAQPPVAYPNYSSAGYPQPAYPQNSAGYPQPSYPPNLAGYSQQSYPPGSAGYMQPSYPPNSTGYPQPSYPPNSTGYPQPSYHPNSAGYPQPQYQHQSAAYPPTYPTISTYPPHPAYPPTPQDPRYYPPGSYPPSPYPPHPY